MKQVLMLLTAALLALGSATGCGGDPPKGINKGKDKPVPEEKKAERSALRDTAV